MLVGTVHALPDRPACTRCSAAAEALATGAPRAPANAPMLVQQQELVSPRGSLDAGMSGFSSRRQTHDLESPLIEQPTLEALEAEQLRAAARAAEAELFNGDGGGSGDAMNNDSRRPSLSSPAYEQHRDSRQLWRLARRNLGALLGDVALHAVLCMAAARPP